MSDIINSISIKGFKSIRSLDSFQLRNMNVLIGANGAGKSNFVSFFRLLRELIDQRLQLAVAQQGGADACLYLGPRETKELSAELQFGKNGYEFGLVPTVDNRLVFSNEATFCKSGQLGEPLKTFFGSGHSEAKLKDRKDDRSGAASTGAPVFKAISDWVVYHFDDTSPTARVRRAGPINDDEALRPNAENLASFLYRLRATHKKHYEKIRDTVRLAVPFFDDFNLRPISATPDLIQLEWIQKESSYPFLPSQLSDGTLRFICLASALLQPELPATVLFDEPELGLHPYVLSLLGDLFKRAADPFHQMIVSTQSALLLNEFVPEDIIVVERHRGQSVFRRLDSTQLNIWLADYTLGELWQKNVLGGRPTLDIAGLLPA